LTPAAEEKIHQELLRDKELVEDKDLPISGYNYAALNDRLEKAGCARLNDHGDPTGQGLRLLPG